MKWDRGHRSDYVEDRRGSSGGGGRGAGGGAFGILLFLFRTFGIKGVMLGGVALGALYLFGGSGAWQMVTGGGGSGPSSPVGSAEDKELKSFVSFVFDDVQEVWEKDFASRGKRYEKARMVLFSGQVHSACGRASASVGPFYCPGDRQVYIDLSFYRQLREQLGAPGDFAQAYVIAHEVGHHVQNLIGNLAHTHDKGADSKSVRAELQADCFAGVWAHSTAQRDLLERGDIAEAMNAAQSIGDDTLQGRGGGHVRPETWTHGSSAQRQRWFKRGLDTGSFSKCDAFSARNL